VKVHLRTFGCRANHYDSEAMRAMLVAGGHQLVDSPTDADAAVFNSCAVTSAAEAELRKSVRAAARRNPGLRSIVTGCAAALDARRADSPIAALPGVSDVIAGADLPAVAAALGLVGAGADAGTGITTGTSWQSTARAVLRVQEGCDEHCTFCVTTVARGANRSRPVESLVAEAMVLAGHHEEIVITGIHVGSYGLDVGTSLGALMETLIARVPRVRFRLSSIEATEVDERLFDLFVAGDRLAPHLHAPLQSGCARVLRRMGRHWYTPATYARAVERLAAAVPHFGLGADVIAGFPGETDAEHGETMALVRSLPFTYLHVFPFSTRPEAPAAALPQHLGGAVISARAAELRALGEAKAAAHRRRRIATLADVIAATGGPGREGVTEDYLTVAVPDSVPRGTRYRAQLQEGQHPLILRAEIAP